MSAIQKMFDGLSTSGKLLFCLGVTSACILLSGLHAVHGIDVVADQIQSLYKRDLHGLTGIKEANIGLSDITLSIRRSILAQQPERRAKNRQHLQETQLAVVQTLAHTREHTFRPEALSKLNEVDTLFRLYQEEIKKAFALAEKDDAAALAAARYYVGAPAFLALEEQIDQAMEDVVAIKLGAANVSADKLAEAARRIRMGTIAIMLLGLALSCLSVTLFLRSTPPGSDPAPAY